MQNPLILATSYGKRNLLQLSDDSKQEIIDCLKQYHKSQICLPDEIKKDDIDIISLKNKGYTITLTIHENIILIHAVEKI